MTSLGMALPLLPGKAEAWQQWIQEVEGSRASEFQASRKRLGITKEVSFLQQSPMGDMGILYIEAEDIASVFAGLATSQESFDVLFREKTHEFFGLDLAQPPAGPPPQTLLDWRASR